MKKFNRKAISLLVILVPFQLTIAARLYADDNLGQVQEHVINDRGNRVAFTSMSSGPGTKVDSVTVYGRVAGNVLFTETFENSVFKIQISPNGKFLGFIHKTVENASSDELRIVDIKSKQTVLTVDPHVTDFQFSGNSRYVVFNTSNDILGTGEPLPNATYINVYRYDIKSGLIELISDGGPTGPFKEPKINRRGNVICYKNADDELIVKDLNLPQP